MVAKKVMRTVLVISMPDVIVIGLKWLPLSTAKSFVKSQASLFPLPPIRVPYPSVQFLVWPRPKSFLFAESDSTDAKKCYRNLQDLRTTLHISQDIFEAAAAILDPLKGPWLSASD